MANCGVLASAINTGLDSELVCTFATPVSIISNQPGSASETLNLRRVGSEDGVQRWEVKATVAQASEAVKFKIVLMKAGRSRLVRVRIKHMLDVETPSGQRPVLAASYPYGSDRVKLIGLREPAIGTFMRFESHSKVYMITGVVDGFLEIFPRLISPVTIGRPVYYGDNCTLDTVLADDCVLGITYENGILASPGQYTFLEKL